MGKKNRCLVVSTLLASLGAERWAFLLYVRFSRVANSWVVTWNLRKNLTLFSLKLSKAKIARLKIATTSLHKGSA